MFLEQSIKPENRFWKYLVGSTVVFFTSTLGQIPFLLAVFYETNSKGKTLPVGQNEMMNLFDSNISLFLLLLSFVFALLGIFGVIKYLHFQTILSVTTGREKIDWNRVFFSFSIWAVFTASSIGLLYYFAPENFVVNFKPIPFAILVVIGTLLIPIQTTTEEYIFRGYLMQGFANLARNRWFPLLMTSVIFGGLHFFNPEVAKMGNIIMVYYIGTGLFLGILTLMDDGMELALGFHAANNLVSALLVTSDWSAFQTHSVLKDVSEPSATFDVLFPVVVIFPILLFIFSYKYKWSNWKERLTGTIN